MFEIFDFYGGCRLAKKKKNSTGEKFVAVQNFRGEKEEKLIKNANFL
jgi:hypothetical protein